MIDRHLNPKRLIIKELPSPVLQKLSALVDFKYSKRSDETGLYRDSTVDIETAWHTGMVRNKNGLMHILQHAFITHRERERERERE